MEHLVAHWLSLSGNGCDSCYLNHSWSLIDFGDWLLVDLFMIFHLHMVVTDCHLVGYFFSRNASGVSTVRHLCLQGLFLPITVLVLPSDVATLTVTSFVGFLCSCANDICITPMNASWLHSTNTVATWMAWFVFCVGGTALAL